MAAACQVSNLREGTDLSSHISNNHTELSFMPATAMQRDGPSSSNSSNSNRDTTLKARKCHSGAIREVRRRRLLRLLPLPLTSKVMGNSPDKDISSRDTTGNKLRRRHLRSAKDILSIGLALSSSSNRGRHTSNRGKVQDLVFPSIARASSNSKTDGNLPSSSNNSSNREVVAPGPILH